MQITNILSKKIIIILLILFIILSAYILYLNINIIKLEDTIKSKNNLYNIQINNRINELNQLNDQLFDLQKLLNIGLDLTKKENIYKNIQIQDEDKRYLLNNIPSGSPLEEIFVTSKFGYRIHPLSGTRRLHTGLDLRAKVGTKIYSPAHGIVVKTRNYDPGGYGKMVTIRHNYGFSTLYGHMNDVYVKEGDIISKNTIIGLSGNTGSSNGPHLHYEVKFLGKYINPLAFVYWNTKTFNSIFDIDTKIKWIELIELVKKRNYN